MANIKKINKLESNLILPNQKIEVLVNGKYKVKKGDTIKSIAKKYGVKVEKIKKWNKIKSDKDLKVGKLIILDKGSMKNNVAQVATEKVETAVKTTQTSAPVQAIQTSSVSAPTAEVSQAPTYKAPVQQTSYQPAQAPVQSAPTSGIRLANGNTAGSVGSAAAQEMAKRTGVPASTWQAIIARESNGQVNAYNPSGASGLFQTMPGWGSTATVQDQINAATKAYNAQGLSAWGF
ncbi:LysM peptidoglycan-binding domain-containing protein [Macrococcus sp. DPC7161]|nr:LysM peptidoglycan-binding domain-containing protein [Macrococcus sp. DPC7161]